MLPKINRLVKEKDFDNVFKNGRKYYLSRTVKIYIKIKENNLKQSRFGFIISKKIFSKAVVRNKLKRRLREIIKKELPNIKKGVDAVIVVLPGFEENNFQKIKKIVIGLLQKAGIISKND